MGWETLYNLMDHPVKCSKNPTWRPLPAALHLPDALDAGHALGQLRLVDDAGPARRVDEAARLVAAVEVSGAAHVLTAVLRVDPPEVHGDVAKVVDRGEAVFCRLKMHSLLPLFISRSSPGLGPISKCDITCIFKFEMKLK